VLPEELEKHCTGAEPILDKNGLASKKAASAHLLLWICRRFSTDDLILQALEPLNLSICIPIGCQSSVKAVSCQQDVVLILCAGLGVSTFFLKTKKRSSSVGLVDCSWRSHFRLLFSMLFAGSVWRSRFWLFHGKSLLCFS
jgi:hypothetical protein